MKNTYIHTYTPFFGTFLSQAPKKGSWTKSWIKHQQSLFLNTDTLFAQRKPIHKTPVAILTLSIHLTLFETGIKVVDH